MKIKEMRYNQLGNSDLKISEVSFGCMSLGSDQGANDYLVSRAIDYGINFFDTADLYQKGDNEKSLGKALKGKRENVLIGTKVGNEWQPGEDTWRWNPSKTYILSAVDQSLKRLQTDYIDLYQLHGGTIEDPMDETIEAFEELKAAGKIRWYGISSIRPNVIREYVKRSNISSVMMQYSLLDRRPEEECLGLLKENNIGVLTRGALAKGLLINKAPKEYVGRLNIEVSLAAREVNNVSGKQRNAAQTALKYVLGNEAITSAVTGIRTIEQLEQVAGLSNAPDLLDEELLALQEGVPPNYYEKHR